MRVAAGANETKHTIERKESGRKEKIDEAGKGVFRLTSNEVQENDDDIFWVTVEASSVDTRCHTL